MTTYTQYIRFRNKAECVPRIRLEKMGISSKRDDANTVGQFGSGAKLAPVAALRKGWEWICLGADDRGQYRLDYVSKEVDGYDIVYYRYTDAGGNVTDFPSSFSVDAGILSWDTDFQIYREAYANALDAHIESDVNYSIDIVSEVAYEPGYFDIYLSASEELLKYYFDHERYFKYGVEEDILSNYGGSPVKMYKEYRIVNDTFTLPVDLDAAYDQPYGLYGKGGIFIGGVEYPTLFSYQYDHFTLNEERRLAHAYQADSIIAHSFAKISDVATCRDMIHIDSILDEDSTVPHELDLGYSQYRYITPSFEWCDAWQSLHGDMCVPLCMSMEGHESPEIPLQLSMRGYAWKRVETIAMYTILSKSGIKTINDVLGERADFDIVDEIPETAQNTLAYALKIVGTYEGIPSNADVAVFTPREYQNTIKGICTNLGAGNGDKIRILLNLDYIVRGSVEDTVATLIHEIDHANSGYEDTDRRFRDLADKRISRLLMKIAEIDGMTI